MADIRGYIGSYTKNDGKGIYSFTIDPDLLKITEVKTAYEVQASTYVKKHGNKLYGIKKENDKAGVQSYEIENDGSLTVINDCLESMETACHIFVSHDGKFLLEAVYGAGLVRLYELNPETGEIIRLIDTVEQEGKGPNEERQDKAHTHYVMETPDHQYAAAVDLGTDEVITFKFSNEGLKRVHSLKVTAGSGPRHLIFNENGKYAYLFTELSNELMVLKYEDGQFELLSSHLAIPGNFKENTQGAAVQMSHDNKFVYVSNRGHQSIAVFKVNGEGESVELVEIVGSGGDWPRDFNIDPSDQFLVCAHEVDGKLVLFKRCQETGKLTMLDDTQNAPEGVCVEFL